MGCLPYPSLSPPSASGLQQHNSFDYISSYSYPSSSNNPLSLLTILKFLYPSLPPCLPHRLPSIPSPSFSLSFWEREFFWLCIYLVGPLHGSPIGATHVVWSSLPFGQDSVYHWRRRFRKTKKKGHPTTTLAPVNLEFVVMMMAEWEIQLYLLDKPIIIITIATRRRRGSSSSSSPIIAFVHVAAAAVVPVPTICDEKLEG